MVGAGRRRSWPGAERGRCAVVATGSRSDANIDGIAKVQGQLTALSNESESELHESGRESAQSVSDRTRAAFPSGAPLGGHATSSIETDEPSVGPGWPGSRAKAGNAKHSYVGFVDFGGSVGRKKKTKRPYKKSGRFMFAKAAKSERPELEPKMDRHMRAAAQKTGWAPR